MVAAAAAATAARGVVRSISHANKNHLHRAQRSAIHVDIVVCVKAQRDPRGVRFQLLRRSARRGRLDLDMRKG